MLSVPASGRCLHRILVTYAIGRSFASWDPWPGTYLTPAIRSFALIPSLPVFTPVAYG